MTPESIKAGILSFISSQEGAPSTMEGSFAANLAAGAALEIWKALQALNAVVPVAFVDESSGRYIDMEADKLGMTRRPGSTAVATMHLTGTAGAVIPKGTAFCTASGLTFLSEAEVTLEADGTAIVTVIAEAAGAAYNVAAGAIDRMHVNLADLTGYTNEAAVGGSDAESDAALFARLDARRKRPSTSGNVYHYEQWALEVPGVGAVQVTPRANGPGTVGVLVVDAAMEPAAETITAAVAAHIEAERPVGVAVSVTAPTALDVTVAATMTLDGSTTKAAVQTELETRLGAYLRTLVFRGSAVLLSQVTYLLMSIPGVLDYQGLTLNGAAANLTIPDGSVPVLGEVTVQ